MHHYPIYPQDKEVWVNVTNVTFGSYLDHICLASNPFFSPSVSLYSDKKPGINDHSTSDGVACKHATRFTFCSDVLWKII